MESWTSLNMTLDQFLTYASFALSVIALIATWFIYQKSYARLKINRISVGMVGDGSIREKNLSVGVSVIELTLANKGMQPATRCSALVIFARRPSLPFHPQLRGRVLSGETEFIVETDSERTIVAGWHIHQSGVVEGPGLSYQEFVDSCLPATIEVAWGRKRLVHRLTLKDVRSQYERFQRQMYEMGL
jgi:hypothetical protein